MTKCDASPLVLLGMLESHTHLLAFLDVNVLKKRILALCWVPHIIALFLLQNISSFPTSQGKANACGEFLGHGSQWLIRNSGITIFVLDNLDLGIAEYGALILIFPCAPSFCVRCARTSPQNVIFLLSLIFCFNACYPWLTFHYFLLCRHSKSGYFFPCVDTLGLLNAKTLKLVPKCSQTSETNLEL